MNFSTQLNLRNYNPLISIIVPCYNGYKFIDRCIKSILNQEYNNFELIIIDDGSTDKSLIKLENYKNLYPLKIKILSQRNQGPSSARNLGIKNAEGEWITFVDIDDLIQKDYLSDFFKIDILKDIDLIIQGYIEINNKNEEKIHIQAINPKYYEDINSCISFQRILHNGFVCGKFYKRRIINDYNLKFDVNWRIKEDLMFILKYLLYTKKVYISNKISYKYFSKQDVLTFYNLSPYYLVENQKVLNQLISELRNININISSLYLDEFNRLCFQEQIDSIYIKNLKKLKLKKRINLLKYTYPLNKKGLIMNRYKTDFILSLLFRYRQFYLFDFIQIILFKLRYRKQFIIH